MRKVIIIVLCIITALLPACSGPGTAAAESAEPSSTMQAVQTAPLLPTPVTTVPIETPEPTEQVTAVIKVKDGDTLKRDIIPQLTAAFSMTEEEVEEALTGAQSSLIVKAKGYRRMEGMIIPGTYEVKDEDLNYWISRWIKESELRYERIAAGVSEKNGLSPDKQLALASIVEWETALCDRDEAEAAAVLLNRIEDGWRLQCCATVEYALGFQRPYLKTADLKVKSDYNTYDFKGVTPGPICCMDDESLAAAIGKSTEKGTYYFFYDYVTKEIKSYKTYKGFQAGASESKALFNKTFDVDRNESMEDKREYFATAG